jgi:tetratricopeptide (TPR) repeat protein
VLRRALLVVFVVACAVGVVAYQVTRPERAPAGPKVFVPSPAFFQDFSPSFRTSIADAYYLMMVQYYGEHVSGDGKLDSLPAMTDLVTSLSPHFQRAYLFGAFALIDAGRTDAAYALLEKGYKDNPDDWRFPAYLGFFSYHYGSGEDKNLRASRWYEKAAAIDGSPSYLARLAAVLATKGGDDEKAVLMWGQAYLAGDKYSQQRAVDELDKILPEEKGSRMKALAPLYGTMPEAEFNALVAELFQGYQE